MDTQPLTFPYGEHFPIFEHDILNVGESEGHMGLSTGDDIWQWDVERELNGDIAMIPISSDISNRYLSSSPPVEQDCQKLLSDWQSFIDVNLGDNLDLYNVCDSIDTKPFVNNNVNRSMGKKIDMTAQCYIVENKPVDIKLECNLKEEPISTSDYKDYTFIGKGFLDSESDVDVDTISEHDTPILHACDIDVISEPGTPILRECDVNIKSEHVTPILEVCDVDIPEHSTPTLQACDVDTIFESNTPILRACDVNIKSEHVTSILQVCDIDTLEHGTPILQACDVDSLLEQFEATEENQIEYTEPTSPSISHSDISNTVQTDIEKRKEILDSLPQELIQRIKASSQRRVVPVIDPIPNNKKRSKKPHNVDVPNIPLVIAPVKKEVLPEIPNCIQLDHDYCASSLSPYPKYPKKDSGFESAEEDEQRNVLKNQPTVKDANGRLMVSLLKINTIQNSIAAKETNSDKTKKKLNLEEYKKRRKVDSCLARGSKSNSNSPRSNASNSQTIIEDEKLRLIKHQQKLKEMAAEVLKTPPRSKITPPTPTNVILPNVSAIPAPTPLLPENIEVKVLVSIGVNTDEVAELKEMRPILKHAIDMIDSNSLITSVIENIQIKKEKEAQGASKPASLDHGEDKTIVYLDKCRPPVPTREVFVQVDMVLPEHEVIKKRGRNSFEHRKCYKRRSSSKDSSYSCSSSSSSSRSRSRSPTTYSAYKRQKKQYMEEERLREVEERRIVYIGGIDSTTTKEELRKRFQQFGPVTNTSIHFREYGDNYGFVTFAYAMDAYKAIEHGNDDPALPHYDLRFGGRRIFCGSNYSDLDNVHEYSGYGSAQKADSFDNLLREAQAKLRKRKTSA